MSQKRLSWVASRTAWAKWRTWVDYTTYNSSNQAGLFLAERRMILKNEAQTKTIQQTGEIAQFLQVRKADLSVMSRVLALIHGGYMPLVILDVKSVH